MLLYAFVSGLFSAGGNKKTGWMILLRADEMAPENAGRLQSRRWARVKGFALLLLVTALFLFAPAMQGIGLTAGNTDQRPADPAAAADRAAQSAVAELASRP